MAAQNPYADVDPSRLIDGKFIDQDLHITSRTRRVMLADGRLPQPFGYAGGRARWRLIDYLKARDRLLRSGAPHGFGDPKRKRVA